MYPRTVLWTVYHLPRDPPHRHRRPRAAEQRLRVAARAALVQRHGGQGCERRAAAVHVAVGVTCVSVNVHQQGAGAVVCVGVAARAQLGSTATGGEGGPAGQVLRVNSTKGGGDPSCAHSRPAPLRGQHTHRRRPPPARVCRHVRQVRLPAVGGAVAAVQGRPKLGKSGSPAAEARVHFQQRRSLPLQRRAAVGAAAAAGVTALVRRRVKAVSAQS